MLQSATSFSCGRHSAHLLLVHKDAAALTVGWSATNREANIGVTGPCALHTKPTLESQHHPSIFC